MPKNGNFRRRDVLKQMGSVSVGVTTMSGLASAKPGERSKKSGGGKGEAKLLEKGEKMRVASEFARTDAYDKLAERARDDGAIIARGRKDVRVGRNTSNNLSREVVEFPLKSVGDTEADSASIVIGRKIKSEEILFAWLDYYHEADDGILTKARRISYSDDEGSNATSMSEMTSDTATGSASKELSEETIDIDDDLVRGETSVNLENEISIQGAYCDWCNFAVGTVCTTACGGAGGFVCGFFGITVPIAGLSCLTFVAVVCEVADRYSGCGSAVANEVCNDRFNVC